MPEWFTGFVYGFGAAMLFCLLLTKYGWGWYGRNGRK